MPTVPTQTSLQTRLNPTANVQQSSIASEAIFAGNANQLQASSRGLNNLGAVIQQQEQERDTAVALNAEVATREAFIGYQTEARSRRGLAADGLVKDTEKWWEDQARTATEGMTDKQRELFIQRMRGTRMSTLESMASYQDGQVRTAKQEGAQASMASAIKLAQDDPSNASLTAEALRTIQITTSKLGAENGDAPEKVQMDMLTRTSTLHSGILGNIVDTNPKAARDYLDRYGAQMTPAARGQIVKTLEIAERNQEVFTFVGDVMLKTADETEALAMVRDKFANDADGMKMAVSEVKTRFNEQEEAKDQRAEIAFDRAWKLAIDGGKGRRGVDAATWEAMSPQQRNTINDELYQLGERWRVAQDRATSKRKEANDEKAWENYYAIREQARKNPKAFKERDLRHDFGNIPKDKREALIDLQSKNTDQLKDITSLDKQISITTGKLGIEKQSKYVFEEAVRDAVGQAQDAKGKPLNEAERQSVIDTMVIDGEVYGNNFFGNDSGRAYEFYGTPEASKFIPSDDEINKDFSKKKGRAPTYKELEAIKKELLNSIGVKKTDAFAL